MKPQGRWGLACVALGLVALGTGAAAAQDPDASIVGQVFHDGLGNPAPVEGVVLAESLDPPGMVFEAPIETGPNTYAFHHLPPGSWRFTVPGYTIPEFFLDGQQIQNPPDAPFTSPIDVPPPGAPRALDLPVSRSTTAGPGLWNDALAFGETLAPNQIAGVVARALGQPSGGCSMLLYTPYERVPNVPVRLEILQTGQVVDTATDAEGRFLVDLPDVGAERTVRVTVVGAIDVCADVAYDPTTGESTDLVVPPPSGAMVGYELPGRYGVLEGTAFFDESPKNGTYDPGEMGVSGIRVTLREAGSTAVRETTTLPDGHYEFEDVPMGWWIVTASGPQAGGPHARIVEMYGATATSGDLPLERPACCLDGELHAFMVGTALWVGERDQHCYEVVARLRDGPGRRSRLLDRANAFFLAADGFGTDPVVGVNDALSIMGVRVVDGWAVVVLRVVASENLFPAGFFGDVVRRLEVQVSNRKSHGVTAFSCQAVRHGAWFTAGATAVPPPCLGPLNPTLERLLDPPAHSPRARFLTLAAVSWQTWRDAVLPGPCRTESESGEGEFQRVDLAIDNWAPTRKNNVFTAALTGGGSFSDRVRVRFQGDLWEGQAVGKKGRLVVTLIERLAGGRWQARVRLQAPERADGNPGSLPAWWIGVQTNLNGARRSAWLDLSAELPKGQVFGWAGDLLYEVLGWRTVRDAAACY